MLTRSSGNYFLLNLDAVTKVHVTARKIESFGEFEKGWHFGEGAPFDSGIIDEAIDLNQEVIRLGLFETDAFPGLSGSVMVTVYYHDFYLEFTIEANKQVTFYAEKNREEIAYEERLSLQEAKNRLREFRRQWLGSEFSKTTGMTGDSSDTLAQHLNLGEMPVSPWSARSVYSNREELSANTSGSTTPWSRKNPLFFGDSLRKSFQPATV